MITRRDLLDRKASDTFIGRREEITFLSQVFIDPASIGFVNLFGISGIGKTSLVNRILINAKAHQTLTCYIDLAFCSGRISLLNKLANLLTIPFLTDAENAYIRVKRRYRELHLRLQASNVVTISTLSQISRLSHFDGELTEASPISQQTPLTHGDIIKAEDALGSDFAFFRDPTAELARAIVLDVNRVMESRSGRGGILIALDRSEKVPENLLTWFRDDLFYDFAERASLIVVGQRPLTDGWSGLLQLGLSVELQPVSESDSVALCARHGIADDQIASWIHHRSGGVPLFVLALCQQYRNDPQIAERGDSTTAPLEGIIDRYLSAIAPDQRELVLKAAILRFVSSENAHSIFGQDAAAQLLPLLRTLHFVSESPKGFVLHDRVRDYFNQYQLRHNPRRFIELSAEAAGYYKECADRGIRRFDCLTEELYHRVRSGGSIGLNRLKTLFDDYSHLNEPQECEVLVATAELAGLAEDGWSKFFHAVILYQKAAFRESRDKLRTLLSHSCVQMDHELRGMASFYYAVTSWYLCEFQDALAYATQAVEIFHSLSPPCEVGGQRNHASYINRATGVIGLTQDRLGYFGEGVATVQEMAKMARVSLDQSSLGYALNSAGYFSWHVGHWRNADSFLSESIRVWSNLHSRFGGCYPIGHRAALRFIVGDPQYGLEELRRCVDMSRESDNREMECKAEHNYAEALWASDRFEECIAASQSAIELAESIGQSYFAADAYRVQALGYLGMRDLEAAASAAERSLELAAPLGARYVTTRCQALVYAAGLEGRFRLPAFDFEVWAKAVTALGFGRAAFDFGRVCLRLGNHLDDAPSGKRREGCAIVLDCALRMNMNALLIIEREMAERKLIANVADIQPLLNTSALSAGVDRNRMWAFVELSVQRGIREAFNAQRWDAALATFDLTAER